MTDRDKLQKYYERDRSYSRDRSQKYFKNDYEKEMGWKKHTIKIGLIAEVGLKVEIGHEAITTKMTIEMSIRRKIVGISKIWDMRKGLENYENACEDRYSKDKDRNKYRDRYRDDSYDRNRSRSRGSSHLPKARKVDNKSKIEQVHKVI